jgi:A/G-specific adenine glycosylase
MRGFQSALINWYDQNKRDLPWRQTADPYVVWISEVILQQTRVDQGLDYFNRFLEKWPSVAVLANAEEQEVLKMWQGLGYYSRARNMLAAARYVMTSCNGVFPKEYDKLIKLKGVGNYTAAAISSISGNEPKAAVDGNVYRVLSRYFGVSEPIDSNKGKKQFQLLADELISGHKPGIFNQAVMEFGALQCVPKNPACTICVLAEHCFAFAHGRVDSLPASQGRVRMRKRFFNYLVLFLELDGVKHLHLHHRTDNDIWKGLYDFPMIETEVPTDFSILLNHAGWKHLNVINGWAHLLSSPAYKHQLTHQSIMAWFHCVQINGPLADLTKKNVFLVDQKQIEKYPVPKLIERFMADNELFK